MRNHLTVALAVLVSTAAVAAPAIAGPLEEGLAAYERFDFATALTVLEPLAEQGNVEAQLRLGLMYHKGWGVRFNNAEAIKWLRLAADQENAQAQVVLSTIYVLAVRPDYAEAFKLRLRSAEHGYRYAQDYLGSMYALGLGVPVDNLQAYFWHDRAAAQGVQSAAEKRDLIAKLLTPDEIAQAQKLAQEWKPK
jgi:TPR repeat protein